MNKYKKSYGGKNKEIKLGCEWLKKELCLGKLCLGGCNKNCVCYVCEVIEKVFFDVYKGKKRMKSTKNNVVEVKPILTFDETSFKNLKKLLEVKDMSCKFCGVKVNKNNVGGFTRRKKRTVLFCKKCLIFYVLEGERKK